MDWTRDYFDSSIRRPRRRSRFRPPVSRHRHQQSNSSEFFYDLYDSDSSTSKPHRFKSSNPFPRSYTWPSDKKEMNWLSSWFQVDLIDFLKRKRRHRQIKKEQKLARERSPERSPRLFVVDPPDRLESPQPRRSALRRASRGRSTMDVPSTPEASARHVPDGARSRRLETEQIRGPRRPRERTPVAEREPLRRGRRVSPTRTVEVEIHQTRSPGMIRSNIDRRSRSPLPAAQVLEHATRPRATERRTSIPRISTTMGRDRRRYPVTPVPGRSSRSLLRDMPRPRVVIHRIPRSQTRDIIVEPRRPREPRIEIQERQPRIIQDGRSRLSSSANRVIGEAQPSQSSSVRFAEPFPTHEPEPRRPSRYRRRRERIVDERGAPVSRQR